MRQVLGDVRGVEILVDDVLIHYTILEDHITLLRTVLRRLRKVHMTVRPSKCVIAKPEIQFFGHKISEGHCLCQNGKIYKNSRHPTPTD